MCQVLLLNDSDQIQTVSDDEIHKLMVDVNPRVRVASINQVKNQNSDVLSLAPEQLYEVRRNFLRALTPATRRSADQLFQV